MKRWSWQATLGISLIVLSVVIYVIHYAIFRDAHHIFVFLIGHLAFLPIEVLLVTLVIHRLLNEREKRSRLEQTATRTSSRSPSGRIRSTRRHRPSCEDRRTLERVTIEDAPPHQEGTRADGAGP